MESIQRKIVEAEDIARVIALMENLNTETKGWKNIEQMQDRICLDHLQKRLLLTLQNCLRLKSKFVDG